MDIIKNFTDLEAIEKALQRAWGELFVHISERLCDVDDPYYEDEMTHEVLNLPCVPEIEELTCLYDNSECIAFKIYGVSNGEDVTVNTCLAYKPEDDQKAHDKLHKFNKQYKDGLERAEYERLKKKFGDS